MTDSKHPYEAIAGTLRAKIESGDLAPGALLPSHRELADAHDANPGTAQRALRQLEGEGLISISPRGAVVSRTGTIPAPRARLASINNTGRIYPRGGTSRLIEVGQDDSPRLRVALGITDPKDWVRFRTRLTLDPAGNAISLSTSYRSGKLVEYACPAFCKEGPMTDGGIPAMSRYLVEPINAGVDRFSARYPSGIEAKLLGTSPTAALLVSRNWWRTPSGIVAEYGESIHAPGQEIEIPYPYPE